MVLWISLKSSDRIFQITLTPKDFTPLKHVENYGILSFWRWICLQAAEMDSSQAERDLRLRDGIHTLENYELGHERMKVGTMGSTAGRSRAPIQLSLTDIAAWRLGALVFCFPCPRLFRRKA